MRFKKFTILFLLIVHFSYAQNDLNEGFDVFGRNSTFMAVTSNNDTDIKGSKYIEDNFSLARISNFGNRVFNVRYNAFDDLMEFKGKDGKIYTLNKNDKSIEITFTKSNTTYRLFDYKKNGNTLTVYFQVITSGKNTLLKKHNIVFIKEQRSNSGYNDNKPPQFQRLNDSYYIISSDTHNYPIKLPKNKKKFADLFANSKKDILKYIKSNQIKLNNESDLTKLFNYLNSL